MRVGMIVVMVKMNHGVEVVVVACGDAVFDTP